MGEAFIKVTIDVDQAKKDLDRLSGQETGGGGGGKSFTRGQELLGEAAQYSSINKSVQDQVDLFKTDNGHWIDLVAVAEEANRKAADEFKLDPVAGQKAIIEAYNRREASIGRPPNTSPPSQGEALPNVERASSPAASIPATIGRDSASFKAGTRIAPLAARAQKIGVGTMKQFGFDDIEVASIIGTLGATKLLARAAAIYSYAKIVEANYNIAANWLPFNSGDPNKSTWIDSVQRGWKSRFGLEDSEAGPGFSVRNILAHPVNYVDAVKEAYGQWIPLMALGPAGTYQSINDYSDKMQSNILKLKNLTDKEQALKERMVERIGWANVGQEYWRK